MLLDAFVYMHHLLTAGSFANFKKILQSSLGTIAKKKTKTALMCACVCVCMCECLCL